jgi:hypothetical protein
MNAARWARHAGRATLQQRNTETRNIDTGNGIMRKVRAVPNERNDHMR